MKVKVDEDDPGFMPYTIHITIENTIEDMDLRALLRHPVDVMSFVRSKEKTHDLCLILDKVKEAVEGITGQ